MVSNDNGNLHKFLMAVLEVCLTAGGDFDSFLVLNGLMTCLKILSPIKLIIQTIFVRFSLILFK